MNFKGIMYNRKSSLIQKYYFMVVNQNVCCRCQTIRYSTKQKDSTEIEFARKIKESIKLQANMVKFSEKSSKFGKLTFDGADKQTYSPGTVAKGRIKAVNNEDLFYFDHNTEVNSSTQDDLHSEVKEELQYVKQKKSLEKSHGISKKIKPERKSFTINNDYSGQNASGNGLKSNKLQFDTRGEMNYFDEKIIQQSPIQEEVETQKTAKIHVENSNLNYFDTKILDGYIDSNNESTVVERNVSDTDLEVGKDVNYFDEILVNNGVPEKDVTKPKDRRKIKEIKNTKQNVGEQIEMQTSPSSSNDKAKVKIDSSDSEVSMSAYDLVKQIRKEEKESKDKTAEEDAENKAKTKEHVSKVNPWMTKWTGKTDSRGFRILKDQVTNLHDFTHDSVVSLLKSSVIYEDENLVAISKPYGLPSHGGPGVHNSIGKVLPLLAKRLDKDLKDLHLVHRLDKESTGVMVMAKSAEMANKLGKMFKKREVIKVYLALTKNVPQPLEGVIDIPLVEGTVSGKYRMVLKPRYPKEMKEELNINQRRGSSGVFEAVTNFKVLSFKDNAALVECQPETGVKHQIRSHLAFGLNTPILGDHKYSHLSKMAPQKLHADMLQRLGVRQAKVRHIPMHLHASKLILPEFKDGKNLFFSAKLPVFFRQNMKWLKLKLPD